MSPHILGAPTRGVRVLGGLLVVLLASCSLAKDPATPAPAGATGPEAFEPLSDDELTAAVERIQRECLRAYPPEMLATMTQGTAEVPAEVDDDPESQMQFLSKELELEKGLFYPSLLEELTPMLRRVVEPGDRFLDLGSGDGRVVFFASLLGARATGIEYDPEMVAVHQRAAQTLDDLVDAEQVEVIEGDFFLHPWGEYDVVFYFDQSSFHQGKVREKLRREMGPEALLVVGHEQEPFEGFELLEDERPMKLYRLESTD